MTSSGQSNISSTVHGDGSHRRSFLYIDDVVDAYDIVLHKGRIGGRIMNSTNEQQEKYTILEHSSNYPPMSLLKYLLRNTVTPKRPTSSIMRIDPSMIAVMQ